MDNKKISGNEVSEQNKEALQSETWEVARKAMKTEIVHFTDMPEILDFEAVKVRKNDGAYGIMWGRLVRDYLGTAYSGEAAEAEIVSEGVTYKVLKRREVTAFYTTDGNTLFDVENKRLKREFERLMNRGTMTQAENDEPGNVPDSAKEYAEGGAEQPSLEEDSSEDKTDVAEKKYENSLKACKPHEKRYFEGPIKEHMLKRFGEDSGFCEDFLQKHKTFQKCIKYMIEKARASVPKSEMQAMIEGSVYLEWMEDYFRKDDKAEEEEKDRKEAERKEKQKKAAAERVAKAKKIPDETVPTQEKKERLKSKKNNKDMEGQFDIFSMMEL